METPSAEGGREEKGIEVSFVGRDVDERRERGRDETRTFQEPHRTIETLGREFVVSEGSKKLRDDDICWFRDFDRSHVSEDDLD